MDFPHNGGLGQGEKLVIPGKVLAVVREGLPTILRFPEPVALVHGPRGAVEN